MIFFHNVLVPVRGPRFFFPFFKGNVATLNDHIQISGVVAHAQAVSCDHLAAGTGPEQKTHQVKTNLMLRLFFTDTK